MGFQERNPLLNQCAYEKSGFGLRRFAFRLIEKWNRGFHSILFLTSELFFLLIPNAHKSHTKVVLLHRRHPHNSKHLQHSYLEVYSTSTMKIYFTFRSPFQDVGIHYTTLNIPYPKESYKHEFIFWSSCKSRILGALWDFRLTLQPATLSNVRLAAIHSSAHKCKYKFPSRTFCTM